MLFELEIRFSGTKLVGNSAFRWEDYRRFEFRTEK